ncbi:MAG: hypothetical protein PUE69_05860 [Ruminococcus sp.]|nr:hypothetical protein [Ruminococcus sp.]MDY3215372.1 hypothetical protein [Ruminococcus sp.]MDY3844831.1 hypothetical protein [Ruminococcus sp.]
METEKTAEIIKERSNTKRPISNIMLDCIINSNCILKIIFEN